MALDQNATESGGTSGGLNSNMVEAFAWWMIGAALEASSTDTDDCRAFLVEMERLTEALLKD